MDLSKLSDSDLEAVSKGDMSKVSDEGLQHLSGAPAPQAAPSDLSEAVEGKKEMAKYAG